MTKPLFEPCIPTRGTKVPSHLDWIHEVKQDGFRLIVSRDGDRVRLFTRNGYDWSSRYPLIVEAARRIRTKQFVLDGEAVLLGVDGISDFDGLYTGQHNDEIQLYAFDILALDGDDLRKLPLHLRRPTSPVCWHVVPTAFTSRPLSKARLGRTYSAPPAT
jgi:bifunctional non-homologous end joining protein LigD